MVEQIHYKVLIIEDSETTLAVCTDILERAGFEVFAVATAEEGGELLEAHLIRGIPFDGVLLDWILQERMMSGVDFLRRIMRDPRFESLSVMIFSEAPDRHAYEMVSQRPNYDIQHKEDLDMMPFRLRQQLDHYSEKAGRSGELEWVAQTGDSKGGRILFVDDSPTVCATYAQLLQDNGYLVTTANSMSAAMELALKDNYQLAVVDFYMPNGNGDEFCEALLADPKTRHIAVVMHSSSTKVVEQSLKSGAIDLIYKDDSHDVFLMRIAAIMRTLFVQRKAEELDVLLMATQTLGVGVMERGIYRPYNKTMEEFARSCGGIHHFIVDEGEQKVHRRVVDKSGKQRAFDLYSMDRGIRDEGVILVQEVTEMADALDSAKEANRLRDEFMAAMSHDLRTPLATIIGNTEYLMSGDFVDCSECQNAQVIDVVSSTFRAGKHQLHLANDILDMSKIEAGSFNIENTPFSLPLLMEDVLGMFKLRAQEQQLELLVEWPEERYQLLGDAQRISQILINLLGNAFKATQQGSIALRVAKLGERLQFVVSDTGIGIPQEALEHLFLRFKQVEGTYSKESRGSTGSGLGLYISKRLTEAMAGELTVESEVGVGSTFTLNIPYQRSEQEDERGNVSTETDMSRRYQGSVLIAEDDYELQLMERRILESYGLTVSVADNGQKAVEQAESAMAENEPFDLILMDMNMPVMDGITAARTLREKGINIPVVALTANVMHQHQQAFAEVGVELFLGKPIETVELIATLDQVLLQKWSGERAAQRKCPPPRKPRAEVADPETAAATLDQQGIEMLNATGKMIHDVGNFLSASSTYHTSLDEAQTQLGRMAQALRQEQEKVDAGSEPRLSLDKVAEMLTIFNSSYFDERLKQREQKTDELIKLLMEVRSEVKGFREKHAL